MNRRNDVMLDFGRFVMVISLIMIPSCGFSSDSYRVSSAFMMIWYSSWCVHTVRASSRNLPIL